jgi:TonB family protein
MKINYLTIFAISFLTLLFVSTINAQTNNNSNIDRQKNEKQNGNKPLKIIKKTPPSGKVFSKCYKQDSRRTSLFIRLRVTFHLSGKITDVEIVKSSGCSYFDEAAVKVAKIIKFKPEVKNGESVMVTKQVEYTAGLV